jgi:hypothetical protein
MRYPAAIGLCLGAFLGVVLHAAAALAHWDMEPRFWADEPKGQFYLRIHNGAHANRSAVKKELNVCFWLEGLSGGTYSAVSEKKCSLVVLKPDEWMDFVFDLRGTAIQESVKNGAVLKKGSYRAVAMAREQKGTLARILFGAALERLYSYFEVK